MSIAANLDLNCRGNIDDLSKKMDQAAAKVKDVGKAEVDTAQMSTEERNKEYAKRYQAERQSMDQSYAGYKQRVKEEDNERKKVARNRENEIKKEAKERDRLAKQSKQEMARTAVAIGQMTSQTLTGLTSGSLSGIGSALGGVASTIGTLIGGPIGGAVVGGIVAALGAGSSVIGGAISKVLSALTGLGDLKTNSRLLGVTTQNLAELQYAGQVAGLGVAQVSESLKGFAQNMNLAGMASGPSLLALRQLNLRGKELAAMPLDKKLETVTDAIAKVGNAADRVRLAQAFGLESWLPALDKGIAGLQKARAEARQLGLGDPAAAEAAQRSQIAWRQLDMAMSSVWNAFGTTAAPAVEKISQLLLKGASKVSGMSRELAPLFGGLLDIGGQVVDIFINIGKWVLNAGLALGKFGGNLTGVATTWAEWKHTALTAIFAVQWGLENWKEAGSIIFDYLRLKSIQFGNDFVNVFTKVIPAALRSFIEAFDDIKAGNFKEAFDKLKKDVSIAMDRPKTQIEIELSKKLEEKTRGLKQFIDDKMKQLDSPMMKKEAPDGAPMGGAPRKSGAMEFGSKEAFSTIYGTQDAQAKALAVANNQLLENKKMNDLLMRIARDLKRGPNVRKKKL